ncbi:MAG: ABC transporter permease [Planctomycetaceae bacterium]|nr:ABC transporter permease [Planctomycetaceae bacterium]
MTQREFLKQWMTRVGPAFGLATVWILFAALKGADFWTWSNQRLMLLQTAVVGTAAVGASLVIISGGIDLSVGSAIAVGTMVVALMLKAGIPPVLAAVGGIGAGCLLGLATGSMVVGRLWRVAGVVSAACIAAWLWQKATPIGALAIGIGAGVGFAYLGRRFIGRVELSPFIVTLGMWGALRGAAKGLGNNQPIYPDQTWLTSLMQPGNSGLFSILAPGVWIMLALATLMAAVLRYTRFGRHVYAVGSNELTARLCGIDVERTKLVIYCIAAGCAGLAAVLQFAFLYGTGDPTTAMGYELKVIASVVIGGASLMGGEGTIQGTILGALIMTVVDNGCTKLGLANWVQEIVTGAIIIAAVTLDQLRHRR